MKLFLLAYRVARRGRRGIVSSLVFAWHIAQPLRRVPF